MNTNKIDGYVHAMYLENKSDQLGVFFDATINVYGYSVEEAQELFLTSKYPPLIEAEDPTVILGLSGLDMLNKIQFIDTKKDMDYTLYDQKRYYIKSEEYWAGWILSHYQDYTKYSFQKILSVIPLSKIISLYYPLHEADVTRSFLSFDSFFSQEPSKT